MTAPILTLDDAVRRLTQHCADGMDLTPCEQWLDANAEALRAALADAERYRFLRDPQRLPEGATDEYGHVYVGISGLDKWAVASVEADAAIDRAIAASKEGSGG